MDIELFSELQRCIYGPCKNLWWSFRGAFLRKSFTVDFLKLGSTPRKAEQPLTTRHGAKSERTRSPRTASVCFGDFFQKRCLKLLVENVQFYTADVFFVWYLIPAPYIKLTSGIFTGCTTRAFVKLSWLKLQERKTVQIYLFHDGGRYRIEISPLICRANQWTGFYIITVSVMKELKLSNDLLRAYYYEKLLTIATKLVLNGDYKIVLHYLFSTCKLVNNKRKS